MKARVAATRVWYDAYKYLGAARMRWAVTQLIASN